MAEAARQTGIISIHALREEGDPAGEHLHRQGRYFYPRPPRGGRRRGWKKQYNAENISIHALREEGDYLLTLF